MEFADRRADVFVLVGEKGERGEGADPAASHWAQAVAAHYIGDPSWNSNLLRVYIYCDCDGRRGRGSLFSAPLWLDTMHAGRLTSFYLLIR